MARHGGRMSENDMLIELRRLRRELAPVRAAEAARARDAAAAAAAGHRRGATARPRHAPIPMRTIRARAGALLLLATAVATLLLGWVAALLLEGVVRSLVDGLLPQPVRMTVNALFALILRGVLAA